MHIQRRFHGSNKRMYTLFHSYITMKHNTLVLLKVKRFKTSFNALQRDKYKQSFKTKIYIYIFLTRLNRILNKDYFNYRLFFFFFNSIVKRKNPIYLKFKKIPKFKKLKAQSVEHFHSRMKESTL